MVIEGQEVKTIEEAFLLLPEEERRHATRVCEYTEAAFKKITTMDLYVSDPRSRTELDMENIRAIRLGSLYHDIGKLLPDEQEPEEGKEIAKEHCLNGASLAAELPSESGKFQPTERRIYLSCIREHHEMPCGGGSPIGKPMKELAFGGRITAIADRLDHLAMDIRSEDAIADALAFLRKEAIAKRIDPEFYKAFSAVRPKLRRIFNEYREESNAVPETTAWIKRRPGRPLELRYQEAERITEDENLPEKMWLAIMCFRGISDNNASFSDVKSILSSAKLALDLGRYFLYELCDTIRRFDTVGAGLQTYAIELPAGWYSQKNLKGILEKIILDEDINPGRLILLTPPDMNKTQMTAFTKQLPDLEAFGIRVFSQKEFSNLYQSGEAFLAGPDIADSLRREDDIVEEALAGT